MIDWPVKKMETDKRDSLTNKWEYLTSSYQTQIFQTDNDLR